MQCPACEFFNTPGASGCLRCGSRLDLAGVCIEPPRASRIGVVRTANLLRLRAGFAWGEALGSATASVRRVLRIDVADWSFAAPLTASIVPGLGQWWCGRRALGASLLAAWMCMAVWAVVSMGTQWNWVAITCMLGVHSLAVNLLLGTALRTRRPLARAGIGLGVYLALLCGVYLPVRSLSQQLVFASPISGFQASSRLRPGDVLLCTGPWLHGSTWNVGEIVLLDYRGVNGRYGVVVDRVIGGPGDVLTVSGGVVSINGMRPPPFLAPLLPPDPRLNLTVPCPEGHVIVFPSLLRWQVQGVQADAMMSHLAMQASIVPATQVRGRVVARLRPLSRFGLVD